MSSYADAVKELKRRRIEEVLFCRCGAFNAPVNTVIELEDDGVARCSVCGHTWYPQLEELGRGYKP